MIDAKLAEKYHLPPIEEYPFEEHDWYETFLIQSDRDALKALEETILGTAKRGTDATELLTARQEARQMLEKLRGRRND